MTQSIDRARPGSTFEHPVWCRPDLCDEVTPGREVEHRSSPLWTRALDEDPDRRLSVAIMRSDHRETTAAPLTAGPVRIRFGVDELQQAGWLETTVEEWLSQADAAALSQHLGELVGACQDPAALDAVAGAAR